MGAPALTLRGSAAASHLMTFATYFTILTGNNVGDLLRQANDGLRDPHLVYMHITPAHWTSSDAVETLIVIFVR